MLKREIGQGILGILRKGFKSSDEERGNAGKNDGKCEEGSCDHLSSVEYGYSWRALYDDTMKSGYNSDLDDPLTMGGGVGFVTKCHIAIKNSLDNS